MTDSLIGINSPREDKEKYLKSRGWFEWYNPDYWCHSACRPYRYCDPTNWGKSFDDAFKTEYFGKSKYGI